MSDSPTSWIGALLTGGIGAALGSVATAVLQLLGHKAESRATAADLVTRAAGNLVDRLEKDNADLRARLARAEDPDEPDG